MHYALLKGINGYVSHMLIKPSKAKLFFFLFPRVIDAYLLDYFRACIVKYSLSCMIHIVGYCIGLS